MLENLKLLIRSGNPLLSLETHDELQATAIVRQAADELQLPLFEWTVTAGLLRTRPGPADTGIKGGKAGPALEYALGSGGDRRLFLFKDLGPHGREPYVHRLLRDVHERHDVHVILLDGDPLPDSIRRLTVPLRLPLPEFADLEQVVRTMFHHIRETTCRDVTVSLTKRDFETLVHSLRGLTCSEAARVVASAIHDDYALTPDDLPRIVEAKRNLLQSTGCLEAISVNFSVDEIGGLENLKHWLSRRRGGMSLRAREFGLDPPRGILLLGVQGCGKSLCAKVVAADWNMPLLRMDPGVLYQKFIGESENRLRDALSQAESMAPAVLWIDEIEKAFASASAESADGGLSQRMFGTLLSWMQDHRSPLFMVATANNIAALPPELMRKGRFDEVFFVDLPDAAARQRILAIHLCRRKRDPSQFDLESLAQATDGYSGAELEQLVVSALYAAFAANVELTDAQLQLATRQTRPLSILMGDKVAALRAWAHGRCVPAD